VHETKERCNLFRNPHQMQDGFEKKLHFTPRPCQICPMNNTNVWKNCFQEAQETLAKFSQDSSQIEKCARFSDILIGAYRQGGTLFSCGNGGSHCDAMHFAEEMTGRYRKDRRPLAALALGDASHVTCVSNDYGFQFIFSRQVEAL